VHLLLQTEIRPNAWAMPAESGWLIYGSILQGREGRHVCSICGELLRAICLSFGTLTFQVRNGL